MKRVLNSLAELMERGINNLIDPLNSIMLSYNAAGSFGVNLPNISSVRIPRLATGAVIPPNREFLAVLGDQQRGTNIEAPLETIVAAFRQVMNEGGGSRTVVLQLNEREFGRIVLDTYNAENRRVGVRIGGAV